MPEPANNLGTSLTRPLKLLAFSIAGFLVALGLCGLDAPLYPHAEFGGSGLAAFGAILFVLSALGGIVAILWLIIAAIINSFRA